MTLLFRGARDSGGTFFRAEKSSLSCSELRWAGAKEERDLIPWHTQGKGLLEEICIGFS